MREGGGIPVDCAQSNFSSLDMELLDGQPVALYRSELKLTKETLL